MSSISDSEVVQDAIKNVFEAFVKYADGKNAPIVVEFFSDCIVDICSSIIQSAPVELKSDMAKFLSQELSNISDFVKEPPHE